MKIHDHIKNLIVGYEIILLANIVLTKAIVAIFSKYKFKDLIYVSQKRDSQREK